MGAIASGIIRFPSDNKGKDRIEVFWKQVKKTDSCWLWQGCVSSAGYGNFHNDGAHRVSFRLAHGQIPDGKWILHRCDVPACVNPKHLYAGTHSDNTKDAVLRKRMHCHPGELSPTHKLTNEIVGRIKFFKGKLSQRIVAKIFSISHQHVSQIWNGRRWGHI